jgi:O-antigen ligase
MVTFACNVIFVSVLLTITVAVLGYSMSAENFIYVNKKLGVLWGLCLIGVMVPLTWLFQRKSIRYTLSSADIILLVWTGWLLAGTLYNNHFSYEKIVLFAAGLFLYAATKAIVFIGSRRVAFERIFLTGVLLISLIECIIVLAQYVGILPPLNTLFRVTGTFHNPAPVSLLLACTLPVLVYDILFSKSSNFLNFLLTVFTIILSVVVLIIVKNRTSWIAILFALIFIFDKKFVFTKYFRRFQSAWWKVTALLAVFALLVWALIMLNPASVASRLLVWKISFHHFLQHPVMGSGYGAFKESYMKWQIEYLEKHPGFVNQTILNQQVSNVSGWVKTAYNEYLEILVEQGVIGLVIFSLFIINILGNFFRKNDTYSVFPIYAFLIVVAILILALFSYPFYSLPNLLLFFFAIAVIDVYATNPVNDNSAVSGGGLSARLIAILPIMGFLLLASFLVNLTRSYNSYALAKQFKEQEDDYEKALPLYQECYSTLRFDPVYLLDYGICFYDSGQHQEAYKEISAAMKLDNNPRIYLLLANLYMEQHQYAASEKMYKAAIGINPALLLPKFLLLKSYIKQQNKAKAIETAQDILSKPPKLRSELAVMIADSTRIMLQSIQ